VIFIETGTLLLTTERATKCGFLLEWKRKRNGHTFTATMQIFVFACRVIHVMGGELSGDRVN
jgi:hypothetical protein